MNFIFMLTHGDRTVPNALDIYRQIRRTDLSMVGFKDVGVDRETLRSLTEAMHTDGNTVFLEVVSVSRDDELRSIEAAIEVGVDYVLGGTHVEDALAVIGDAPVSYCPFPGTVVGHPSELQGSITDIAAHAGELTRLNGVHGVDLLAYRHRTVDPIELCEAVVQSVTGPVIAAGSVDSEEQISRLGDAGVWGFTIGGAIFENRLPGSPSVAGQIEWVLEVAARA